MTAGGAGLPAARWWTMRRAQSFKPRSYTCPLCGEQFHAMTEHILLAPEGDTERRRHAHSTCVRAARAQGLLLQKDEWEAAERDAGRVPAGPGLMARLLRRS